MIIIRYNEKKYYEQTSKFNDVNIYREIDCLALESSSGFLILLSVKIVDGILSKILDVVSCVHLNIHNNIDTC